MHLTRFPNFRDIITVDFVTEMWKNEVTLGYLFALTGHGRPRAMARRDRTARTISTSHRTSRSEAGKGEKVPQSHFGVGYERKRVWRRALAGSVRPVGLG